MNFSYYIAKRYLRSASKNNAINIINGIAGIGIVVVSAALFIFMSVFSGLIDFSLSFSNSIDPDVKAESKLGKSFDISAAQEQQLHHIKGIAHYSKVVEERVLFMFKGKEMVTYIKGVDSTFTLVSTVKGAIIEGRWMNTNTVECAVGYGISDKLSIGLIDVNNLLEVYVPKPGKGPVDNTEDAFVHAQLVPTGVFAISEELDSKYVFADLGFVQGLLGYKPNRVTAIEIALTPGADESAVMREVNTLFGNKLNIKNRTQLNASLYKMLNTENLVLYLIGTLVNVIALFNLIGALIMMVIDKKSNLKTLHSLGAEVRDLRKIFFLQGTLLTVIGCIAGILIGAGVILLQQHFQLIMITPTLAYPVKFTVQNILIVLATVILLGCLASFIASRRINAKLLK